MQHTDHVELIRSAVGTTKGVWADFGSGTGAFALALADITNQEATIYSIDKDERGLAKQREAFDQMFPQTPIHYRAENFTSRLELPLLDGIIMGNSLHFIRDKVPLLTLLKSYLKPAGKLIMIEYNADEGNIWVPYPFSYETFKQFAVEAGYTDIACTGIIPSHFLDEMYCAVATNP